MRAGVVVPAVLAVLLVVAIAVAVVEFLRADRTEERPTSRTRHDHESAAVARTARHYGYDGRHVHRRRHPTAAPAPPPAVVIGANCSPEGSTGTTDDGSTAYCSTLQSTGTTIWSLTQGDVPSPTVTVTTDPTEAPLPDRGGVADTRVHAADRADPAGMPRRHPAQQRSAGAAMKFAVFAPVAAGVTADPNWMTAVRAAPRGVRVRVDHRRRAHRDGHRYSSVYPYDASGRVEHHCGLLRCPIPLTCWRFWPAAPNGSGLATGCAGLAQPPSRGACQTGRDASTRCRVGGCGCASASGWLKEEIEACGADSPAAVAGPMSNSR